MKRTITLIAALGLVVGACGGDDDSGAPPESTDETEESVDESVEETTAPTTAADDETTDDDQDAEQPVDDTAADSDSDGDVETSDDGTSDGLDPAVDDSDIDDSESISIQSLDDIPSDCRDAMAEFLRDVEPIVSDIDWENATLSDFEAVSADFTEISEDFDASAADAGCGNLDFTEGNEFELLIDFADDEAPGVVPFLEFINLMQGAVPGGDDGSSADGAFETCQDGIDFVQNLVDTYDRVEDVPAGELVQLQNLTALISQCTPEELAFLENEDIAEFFGGQTP